MTLCVYFSCDLFFVFLFFEKTKNHIPESLASGFQLPFIASYFRVSHRNESPVNSYRGGADLPTQSM